MKRIDFETHYYIQAFLDKVTDRKDIPRLASKEQFMYHGGDGVVPIRPILPKLLDLDEGRIADMDRAGVDVAILSASLGIEQLPPAESLPLVQQTHDALYDAICCHPGRFLGSAVLPTDDLEASVTELKRVRKLGFVGWNAFSNYGSTQLDDPRYFPLLETCDSLGMYVYIHPTVPAMEQLHGRGPALTTSGLGFAVDVMVTVSRMIFGGVFDRLPDLKVIIGHLGEGLPFLIQRMDDAWTRQVPATGEKSREIPSTYFRRNIWISTSGNFSAPAFFCARDMFGIDRILFGSDYPMESMEKSTGFIESLNISMDDTRRIYTGNAAEGFGLESLSILKGV